MAKVCREPEVVFIVGTSHVSAESAKDVDLVVSTVQPDAVVVELCKGRSAVLYQEQGDANQRDRASQPLSMTGAFTAHIHEREAVASKLLGSLCYCCVFCVPGDNLFQAFFRSLKLGGTTALAIQLMLSYALRRVIPQDGSIIPGLEFNYAYKVRCVLTPCGRHRKITHCQLQ